MRRVLVPLLALVAAGVLGGVAAVAVWETAVEDDEPASVAAEPSQPVAAGTALSLRELYRRALPGVVEVSVGGGGADDDEDGEDEPRPRRGRALPFPVPPVPDAAATGSGFVIDDEGHIVTNQHVVGDAESVTVTFSNGEEAEARVVGTDPSSDVALLELENPGEHDLRPLELGSAEQLEVGDAVAAIGSPFGLEGSLTTGIVSALDREIQAPNGFTIDGAIQTDAALNRGNSGGPLLDAQGRVIGVTSQIQTNTGGNEGIGYAVPVETVREVVEELRDDGQVQYAYLGVRLEDTDAGVRVAEVISDGPAARAGLREGDIVLEAAGESIETTADLRREVTEREPGDSLTLEIRRGGDTRTIDVELGRRPRSIE